MTTTLPTLYKRNSNATAIQQWTISVTDATITTMYGQVGGAMQTTSDTVTQGKNLGKKNATTPEQQAMLEAEAQHERKRKAGYVVSL
jgi:predicted DNA-binding WGR domain protein